MNCYKNHIQCPISREAVFNTEGVSIDQCIHDLNNPEKFFVLNAPFHYEVAVPFISNLLSQKARGSGFMVSVLVSGSSGLGLCSWARHFTFTVPLSNQVYKWVPENLMQGVAVQWAGIPSRGV